jgi:predicted permease
VALSVALLSGAGLLARSLHELSHIEPGFDAERILAFRLSGSWGEHYDNPVGLLHRIDTTVRELASLPGVEMVATSWTLPGAPGPYEIEFEATPGRAATEPPLVAGWRTVSPGYFATMRIPLQTGELCRSLPGGVHRPGSTLDLLVNRRFADRYFAARSPIGTHLSWDNSTLAGRIVGVVSNARELGIDRDVVPTVYACDSAPNPFPWFVVRTTDDPDAMAASIRARLAVLEPLRSMYDTAPLDERIDNAYAQHRVRTWLLTIFSLTALGLVCVGVYGTLSYAVGLRRREVALRLALGALRRSVVQQLMTRSIRVVGIASGIGLVLALLFGQSLSTMLYNVTPADPLTLGSVVVIVLTVGLLAAAIPAARATFVQPMRALREE